MKLSAPFPYFGGKSRIADEVWARFGDTPNYVEPFFGSGAMLFSRPGWQPTVTWTETVNDASGYVANFWRALQADPEAVTRYADWPVNENDLHARHAWLVREHKQSLGPRLEGDPEFYDAKVAGWWVWGMCCWIGGGFCGGKGPWQTVDGELVNMREYDRSAGQGVNRQRVHLGNGYNAGTGEAGLLAWMQALADRLERVRVCCGDWSRVMGRTVTEKHGTAAIFLDPPYSTEAGRDMAIYEQDCGTVAHDVRKWAIANGDNPKMRIALCGYTDEHAMPGDWERLQWSTAGGYESQSSGANENQHREVIWFSPGCLKPQRVAQMDMFGERS